MNRETLKYFQSLPLDVKIKMTQKRIDQAVSKYGINGVYVSFSGGKDSTVLLDICRELYPGILAVYCNTGLEYPEIHHFVKSFDNVKIIYPGMSFVDVIKKYGYPVISKEIAQKIHDAKVGETHGNYLTYAHKQLNGIYKSKNGKTNFYNVKKYKPLLYVDFKISHMCCDVMKKAPFKCFEKSSDKIPIIATMACESKLRESNWMKIGCNSFDTKRPESRPLSFWTEKDIIDYIDIKNIPVCSVYGNIVNGAFTGCKRTGCLYCGFGCHMEKGYSRFEILKETHPGLYEYCMYGGEYDENLQWIPNKNGLGLSHVFNVLNDLFGKNFIRW